MRKFICFALTGLVCLFSMCSNGPVNDLRTNMLQGNVHTLTMGDGVVMTFDTYGQLQTMDFGDQVIEWRERVKTTWDGNVRTDLLPSGAKWVRTFDDKGRQISFDRAGEQLLNYTYEADSFLPATISLTNLTTGESETLQIAYDEVDEQGNWLKLQLHGPKTQMTNTQQIEYYSDEEAQSHIIMLDQSELSGGLYFYRLVARIMEWLLLIMLWAIIGFAVYGFQQKRKGNDYKCWIKRLTRLMPLFFFVSITSLIIFRIGMNWMVKDYSFGKVMMGVNLIGGLAMIWFLFRLLDWKEVKETLLFRSGAKEMLLMLFTLITYFYLSWLFAITFIWIALFILAAIVIGMIVMRVGMPGGGSGGKQGGPDYRCGRCRHLHSNGTCALSGETIYNPSSSSCDRFEH